MGLGGQREDPCRNPVGQRLGKRSQRRPRPSLPGRGRLESGCRGRVGTVCHLPCLTPVQYTVSHFGIFTQKFKILHTNYPCHCGSGVKIILTIYFEVRDLGIDLVPCTTMTPFQTIYLLLSWSVGPDRDDETSWLILLLNRDLQTKR